MKYAQPTLRKPARRDHGKSDLEPSKLGSTLRELAVASPPACSRHWTHRTAGWTNRAKDLAEVYAADLSDLQRRSERTTTRRAGARMSLLCDSESQSVSADSTRLPRVKRLTARTVALLGLPRFAKLNARRRSSFHVGIVRRLG